jgi:2'-5' RNA ligase
VSARLFAAVDLPEHVREVAAGWARDAVGPLAALRPVRAENLHVTLVFLGDRDEDQTAAIGDLVTACAAGRAPLRLGGPVWLAPRRPHVLALAVEDPDRALAALQAAVSDALRDGTAHEPEARAFLPHVTVARVRRGERVRPAELALPDPPRLAFAAEALTLYRSRAGRYEPVARAALGTAR